MRSTLNLLAFLIVAWLYTVGGAGVAVLVLGMVPGLLLALLGATPLLACLGLAAVAEPKEFQEFMGKLVEASEAPTEAS